LSPHLDYDGRHRSRGNEKRWGASFINGVKASVDGETMASNGQASVKVGSDHRPASGCFLMFEDILIAHVERLTWVRFYRLSATGMGN